MVLYYLDLGTVLFHAGKYKESDEAFDKAEQRMVELYTKSVTKTAGMLVLNDATVDYAGEPFERALTNAYRAFNWLFQGKTDEAVVEARKAGLFLDELNRALGGKSKYKDDAFAQYLSALLYADAGKLDDARISMDKAMEAYSWYASDYGTPAPHFDFPADDKKTPRGELIFFHFNGAAPIKISKSFQIAWNQAIALARESADTEADGAQFKNGLAAGITGKSITVSYPEYQAQPSTIRESEVIVDSDTATSAATVVVEDLQAIASKTLQDRMALIRTRAIARATIKYVIAEVAARAAAKACDQMPGGALAQAICKAGTRGAAHGVAAASEIADTRCWGTLPAQIRMARIKLPTGKHTVAVNFKGAAGNVVSTYIFKDVNIENSKRTYLTYRTLDATVPVPSSAGTGAKAAARKK
ncbi:MAG TPA: hypothetical protein DEB40_10715 [Elusimicrobia bacterium]|nr:hypothetical protein [Elusimicrobiota bacterium]